MLPWIGETASRAKVAINKLCGKLSGTTKSRSLLDAASQGDLAKLTRLLNQKNHAVDQLDEASLLSLLNDFYC
jgi:hypothetical protein